MMIDRSQILKLVYSFAHFWFCVSMYSVQECRESSSRMVVNEEDVVNIMAGMQHAGGIKLNDHKRKLKNRSEEQGYPGGGH